MIQIVDKAKCTGCHACLNICPRSCIEMKEDEQGFKYPEVDSVNCVDCGMCEQVCHMTKSDITSQPTEAYGAKNKDLEERMNSSSGGIFALMAKWILDRGGSVYGAAFNKDYEVEHIRVTDKKDLKKLQTSKYVQSIIGKTYSEVRDDLLADKYVLFTGTPCQIAGLKVFLRKDFDKLFCQDIMCHGVPSPKLWKKYLNELNAGVIKRISFRDKAEGWADFHVVIEGQKRSVSDVFNKNTYMRAFLADASLRPSCYNCHYKNLEYAGDFCLGDFWGIEEFCPEINDNKGVSLLLINTSKGKELLDKVRDNIELKDVPTEAARVKNGAAVNGAAMNEKNTALYNNIDNMTVHRIVEKYIRGSFLNRVKNKLKK